MYLILIFKIKYISVYTSRLTGQQTDSSLRVPEACFLRAPPGVAEAITCEVSDTLSSLMVSGAEELVSRVVRVKGRQGADLHLPVGVVVPFCARYHGCYRDVSVKMMDEEGRTSYITPRTTEGAIGGQRVRLGNNDDKKSNACLY